MIRVELRATSPPACPPLTWPVAKHCDRVGPSWYPTSPPAPSEPLTSAVLQDVARSPEFQPTNPPKPLLILAPPVAGFLYQVDPTLMYIVGFCLIVLSIIVSARFIPRPESNTKIEFPAYNFPER